MTAQAPRERRPRWKRWVWWTTGSALILVVLAAARAGYAFRDRTFGYTLALDLQPGPSKADPRPLRAGFARNKINPDLTNLEKHPVYIAGFGQNRRATALHDNLWAIACVLDDGYHRAGIVALDAIGFFHDDVVRVRRSVNAAAKLDYIVVCSTHNHSTPDLMGLWGPGVFKTGVDPAYRQQVIQACVRSLETAAAELQPAVAGFHEISVDPRTLMADTRKPEVFDPDLRILHVLNATNGATLGSIVAWANHPETPWSRNTELTSDFCGYLRDALETGVSHEGRTLSPALGGIHLYVNGAVGGLMSTTPRVTVRDPYLGEDFTEPSHEKARALGRSLAARVAPALAATNAAYTGRLPIGIHARTLRVRLDNKLYLLAGFLGLIDRGHSGWRSLKTEVALLTLGDAAIACVPGEVYPEIVNGGVEAPPGRDFDVDPVETPPIRQLMPGRVKFVFGLANDEIGYIIPKSEWDHASPYLYNAGKQPYGEENSVGPEAGPVLHAALRDLCRHARDSAGTTEVAGP